ncbi:MAG: hypothetical protein BWY89_01379 [Bacteroidetes bacterium ADurb.BinA012]|nr:MAG: hypothetical protein BWY89_01379 [Bacteroidetes bacterium ADurb.BinA012]
MIKSPSKESNAFCCAKGRNSMAPMTVARVIDGAILKIRPVVSLNTLPFLSRRERSFHGWNIPGPLRPEAMLFVRRITPGKKRAATTMSIKPAIIRLF